MVRIWSGVALPGSCPDACPFLYACISRLSDSVVVQNTESYTAFFLVAPVLLYPMHNYRNYEKYLRTILATYMPHFAPLRSTTLAAALVPYGGLFEIPGSPNAPCSILIDVGYSYSHVTPVVDGKVVWSGIRR